MQVKNDTSFSFIPNSDRPLVLKEGETYQAVVKEKLPNDEAILQIKGQDVKVKVEGSLPDRGRLTVKVTDTNGQTPVIEEVVRPNSPAVQGTAPQKGELPSSKAALAKGIEILKENGVPITRSTFNQLSSFMEKASGTAEQKLETISAMVKKGLEFTAVQLKSVHEALHGSDFSQSLQQLTSEVAPEQTSRLNKNMKVLLQQQSGNLQEEINLIRKALQSSNLSEALSLSEKIESFLPENIKSLLAQAKQQLLENKTVSSDLLNKINEVFKLDNPEIAKLLNNQSKASEPSLNLQTAINAVRKQPDIQAVLTVIKEQLLDSDALLPEQAEKLQNSISKAEKLAQSGRELASRQELITTLETIQKTISASPLNEAAQQEVYEWNSDFIASLPIQSRNYIVSAITKKLSQMAIDFKEVKRDISKNLQSVQILLERQTASQAKPLLESTIKQLDQTILKSDFMLYTDMATEKKLLKASSQLAEAKAMLEKGDVLQASKITQEVKSMVDKIIFKPSDTRIQHFVSKELFQLEQPSLEKQLAFTMDSLMQAMKDSPTARQVFEHIRSLGLTYESEQAYSLISKEQETTDFSLKNALLKLGQANTDQSISQKADQLITQLTGQQLLSKTDTSSLQSMMFTLPFLLKDQTEQVKVFLNSKNSRQKVDWENCDLYFLIETKRLGEVGIQLSAVERTLSVTIKNDKPDFKEKVQPLAAKAKERLKEIGYNIGAIQFTKLSAETKKQSTTEAVPKRTLPQFTGRGYDFTV